MTKHSLKNPRKTSDAFTPPSPLPPSLYLSLSTPTEKSQGREINQVRSRQKIRNSEEEDVDVEEFKDASIHKLPNASDNPRRSTTGRQIHGIRSSHEPRPRRLRRVPQTPPSQGLQEDHRRSRRPRRPPNPRSRPPQGRRSHFHDRRRPSPSRRVPRQGRRRRRIGRSRHWPRRRPWCPHCPPHPSTARFGWPRSWSWWTRSGDDAAADLPPSYAADVCSADDLPGAGFGAGDSAAWADAWVSAPADGEGAPHAAAVCTKAGLCTVPDAAAAVWPETDGSASADDERTTSSAEAGDAGWTTAAEAWDAASAGCCSCVWPSSPWDATSAKPLATAATLILLHYQENFTADMEVKIGLFKTIEWMYLDIEDRVKVDEQLEKFKKAEGMFVMSMAILTREKKQLALWWESYGEECKELQLLAIRVLSLTCSATRDVFQFGHAVKIFSQITLLDLH